MSSISNLEVTERSRFPSAFYGLPGSLRPRWVNLAIFSELGMRRMMERACHDGREVWVMGEEPIDDATSHAVTAPMAKEYAPRYDRVFDAECQDILLTEPQANEERRPAAFELPKTSAHLRRLEEALRALHFISGGRKTQTPSYGTLIALEIFDAVKRIRNSPIEAAAGY